MTRLPQLRDQKEGHKTLIAFMYALLADCLGILWMIHPSSGIVHGLVATVLAIHGRIIAAYLVHEAAHDSVFVESWANRYMGIASIWLAGCPYCNFDHIRKMHIAHHRDRTDLVEFDYRSFVQSSPGIVKTLCCVGEYCFIPIVETFMHLRQALGPLFIGILLPQYNQYFDPERIKSAGIGTTFQLAFYLFMWHHNALFWQLVCGAMMLHILAFGDAFHHTYDAVFPQYYTPGPGNRTAQYEEENTYSNLISISFPQLNLLNLNFGYHNAHHKRPMVPWYRLPSYHDKLYPTSNVIRSKVEGSAESEITLAEYACPQILSLKDIFASWHRHRLRRVLEEDYGEVHPLGAIDRARDFVGTLGASFLTV